MTDIPMVFLQDITLTHFWKYYPKILVGKRKLPFPINISNIIIDSKYFQTLLCSTDIKSLEQIHILSDYDIDYDNVAFQHIWFTHNLHIRDGQYHFLTTYDICTLNTPKEVLEARTYCNYLNLPFLYMLDTTLKTLCETQEIPDDIKEEVTTILKDRENLVFKRDLRKCIKDLRKGRYVNLTTKTLFEKFSIVFSDQEKLDLANKVQPEFKIFFFITMCDYIKNNSRKNITQEMLEWVHEHKYEFPLIVFQSYPWLQ
jgi:hypothetical protein